VTGEIGLGVAGVLAGGFLNGSWVLPMKRLTGWRWENTWLAFSILGLVVIPWIVAVTTVPQLGAILGGASGATMAKVLIFGFGWGVGNILFGLGVNRLGIAVGYGIILGLIAPIGTFLPLIVLHPERLWTSQGLALMIGTVLVVVGILFCAIAGRRREQEAKTLAPMIQTGFMLGLVICIASGILSPMLNFAFVFGEELQRQTAAAGVSASMSSNALWALTMTAGFVANAGYAVYLLGRNHTWGVFSTSPRPVGYWAGAGLMGVLLFASFMAYGSGAIALGPLGGIVGWPLFMSMSLITSNAWGAITGEWKGASRRAYGLSLVGIAFLIVAIVVISRGGSG
jgi:L-rhamnose-H+ transport protein